MPSKAHKDLAEYVSTLPEKDQRWNSEFAKLVGAAKYGGLPFAHWTARGYAEAEALQEEAGIPADSWPMYSDYKPDPPPLPPEAQVGWDQRYEWPRIERAAKRAAYAVITPETQMVADDVASHREDVISKIRIWVQTPKHKARVEKCLANKNNRYMAETFEGLAKDYLRDLAREIEAQERSWYFAPWYLELPDLRLAVLATLGGVGVSKEVAGGLERLEQQKPEHHKTLVAATKVAKAGVVDFERLGSSLNPRINATAAKKREQRALRELQRILKAPQAWPQGPGSRSVIPNAAILARQNDGKSKEAA